MLPSTGTQKGPESPILVATQAPRNLGASAEVAENSSDVFDE